jgi:hypothetical protein
VVSLANGKCASDTTLNRFGAMAVARELATFIWEMGQVVPLAN